MSKSSQPSGYVEGSNVNPDGTRRELSDLNVQMIAIGGAIGTGLFLGSGSTIHRTGPSILLVYLIIGFFFYLMMRAIGEMMYTDPSKHTFVAFIHRYMGPKYGRFAEWNYWLTIVLTSMAEMIAISTYVRTWFPTWPGWLVQVVFLLAMMGLNLFVVSAFGKAETVMALIKIFAILALIVIGIIMVIMHYKSPSGHVASFMNVLGNFKMFPNGAAQFIFAFPMVFFAFQGIEFVGITTAETKNPRQVLPKAINQTLLRILIFYIGALFVIMSITPWRKINAASSPFVQIFSLAGIPAAGDIINLVVIIAATSSLNSFLFSGGRHLYQLALESGPNKMQVFKTISLNGIPVYAVIETAILTLFAPIITATGMTDAFSFVTSISSDIYIIVCVLTMISHLRYRQSSDFLDHEFQMPFAKFANPLTILFFAVIYVSLFFSPTSIWAAVGATVWAVGFFLVIAYRDKQGMYPKDGSLNE